MKDDEVLYLKSKFQEAIGEYEQARRNEASAREESIHLKEEV
jgi:hypothetical protein